MTKKVNRVRNWRKYNEALVNRGSITFWIDEKALEGWYETTHNGAKGCPKEYSDLAIKCALTVKAVFNLGFRAVEGLIKSLIKIAKLAIKVPDYTSFYELAERKNFELIVPPQHNSRTSEERPRNKNKASKNAVKKRDK